MTKVNQYTPNFYAEALKYKFISDISFLIEFLKGVLGLFLS